MGEALMDSFAKPVEIKGRLPAKLPELHRVVKSLSGPAPMVQEQVYQ
jgi:hypothetical protein